MKHIARPAVYAALLLVFVGLIAVRIVRGSDPAAKFMSACQAERSEALCARAWADRGEACAEAGDADWAAYVRCVIGDR